MEDRTTAVATEINTVMVGISKVGNVFGETIVVDTRAPYIEVAACSRRSLDGISDQATTHASRHQHISSIDRVASLVVFHWYLHLFEALCVVALAYTKRKASSEVQAEYSDLCP
jgi:hypothetical protein